MVVNSIDTLTWRLFNHPQLLLVAG